MQCAYIRLNALQSNPMDSLPLEPLPGTTVELRDSRAAVQARGMRWIYTAKDRRMRAYCLSKFGVIVQKAFGSPWNTTASALGRRSYSIYEDFNVFSGSGTGKVIIDEYDDTGFKANGVRHEGSMIALGKLMFSWTPRSLVEVTPESLAIFQLLRPAPEILVIGCGKRIERVSPEVRDFMKSNRIKIEVVDTRNAASTFNILNEEGRQVAVAMLPHGWSST